MKIGTIVSIRDTSTRFPGKGSINYGESTLAAHLIWRVRTFFRGPVICAMPKTRANDKLSTICAEEGAFVVRGSETDLHLRHTHCFKAYDLTHALIIEGDAPLFSISGAKALLLAAGVEPKYDIYDLEAPWIALDGPSMHLINQTFLRKSARILKTIKDRERWLEQYWVLAISDKYKSYFTKHKIHPIELEKDKTLLKMSIDYPLELAIQNMIINYVGHIPTAEEYTTAFKEVQEVEIKCISSTTNPS